MHVDTVKMMFDRTMRDDLQHELGDNHTLSRSVIPLVLYGRRFVFQFLFKNDKQNFLL